MGTDAWFDSASYLAAKAEALNMASGGTTWTAATVEQAIANAGLTVEEHYTLYGWKEGLSPNVYYNENEYVASKVAALNEEAYDGKTDWTAADFRTLWSGNPFVHYLEYGAYEANVNPSISFDDDAYYAAKASSLSASAYEGKTDWTASDVETLFHDNGLTPITHYMLYGKDEGFYTPSSTETTKWSISTYLCADNDLEAAGLNDVNEMEAATIGDNITVAYQLDRSRYYTIADGNWTDTRRGVITQQDDNMSHIVSLTADIGEQNMGSSSTLTNFINWSTPATGSGYDALILWNHGAGAYGCCWDEENGSMLTVQDIATAITHSTTGHLDLVAFDCCNMGILDQAYALNGLVDVMVGSEDTIPEDGYEYTDLLTTFSASSDQSVETLAAVMVESYKETYSGTETLSALDLSGMDTLLSAMQHFDSVWDASNVSDSVLAQAESETRRFDDNIDLYDFMENVISLSSSSAVDAAASLVASAVDSVVLSSCGSADAHGLSIYMPVVADTSYVMGTGSTLLAATGWSDIYTAVWSA